MKKIMIGLGLGIALIGGFIWWVAQTSAPITANVEAATTCYRDTVTASQVITLTNDQRIKNGLPALLENTELDLAAGLKGTDAITHHYWAHVSPSGVTPWDWFKHVGYDYSYAGENLAQDEVDSKETVNSWMHSPGHRANILNPHYTEIGTAIVCGTTDHATTLIVSEYGSR